MPERSTGASARHEETPGTVKQTKSAIPVPNGYAIGVLVFGGGAIGMVLELVGSRLLAPYFGNSLFIWTSLIGVMLGFMSLGYFLGGRLADRHLDPGYLFWILIGAATAIAMIAVVEGTLLPVLARGGTTRLLAVLSATVLFAVPSTLLGMVSPYCIRLRMHTIEDSGSTVGSLYAVSTLGSIVGTFAAGFWLISMFGTRQMLTIMAVGLGLLSLIVIGKGMNWKRLVGLGVIVATLLLGATTAHADTVDTQYDRYFLRQIVDPATGRPLVGLSRDEKSAESAAYRDTGEPYRFEYYNFYDLATKLGGPVERTLLIGGGTFSYPRLFAATNPTATMDVVEIDGDLYGIAKSDFGYVDDPRLKLSFEDGRTFMNRAEGPYDAIFIDAFKSEQTVPYQLTTLETWKKAYDLLDEDGVLVMNVIASPDDERAQFFNSLFATISDVFPEVRAFRVQDSAQGRAAQHLDHRDEEPRCRHRGDAGQDQPRGAGAHHPGLRAAGRHQAVHRRLRAGRPVPARLLSRRGRARRTSPDTISSHNPLCARRRP